MAGCVYDPYTLPTVTFVGGSTQELVFRTYFNKGKRPFDLSECTANFAVINYVNKRGEPLISKEMDILQGDAWGDEDAAYNIAKVTLDADDTMELTGKYIYQITVKDRDGMAEIPDQGIMMVANNINKGFLR